MTSVLLLALAVCANAGDNGPLKIVDPGSITSYSTKRIGQETQQTIVAIGRTLIVSESWICATLDAKPVAVGLPFSEDQGVPLTFAIVAVDTDNSQVRMMRLSDPDPTWVIQRVFHLDDSSCGIVVKHGSFEPRLFQWNLRRNELAEIGYWPKVDTILAMIDPNVVRLEWRVDSSGVISSSLAIVDRMSSSRVTIPPSIHESPRFPFEHSATYGAGWRWYAPYAKGKGLVVFNGFVKTTWREGDSSPFTSPRYPMSEFSDSSLMQVFAPSRSQDCLREVTLKELVRSGNQPLVSIIPIWSPWSRGTHLLVEVCDRKSIAWRSVNLDTGSVTDAGVVSYESVPQLGIGSPSRTHWPVISTDGTTVVYSAAKNTVTTWITLLKRTSDQGKFSVNVPLVVDRNERCVAITPGNKLVLASANELTVQELANVSGSRRLLWTLPPTDTAGQEKSGGRRSRQ